MATRKKTLGVEQLAKLDIPALVRLLGMGEITQEALTAELERRQFGGGFSAKATEWEKDGQVHKMITIDGVGKKFSKSARVFHAIVSNVEAVKAALREHGIEC